MKRDFTSQIRTPLQAFMRIADGQYTNYEVRIEAHLLKKRMSLNIWSVHDNNLFYLALAYLSDNLSQTTYTVEATSTNGAIVCLT
jgi:hypothetical protein